MVIGMEIRVEMAIKISYLRQQSLLGQLSENRNANKNSNNRVIGSGMRTGTGNGKSLERDRKCQQE